MFSEKDSVPTIDASKDILEEINEMSENVLRNLRPVDTRTEPKKIEDQFIPIDGRTQQELEDDDYLSFQSESEDIEVENIDTTAAWDNINLQLQNLVQYLNCQPITTKKLEQ